jgi:hypothetical protein
LLRLPFGISTITSYSAIDKPSRFPALKRQ